MRGNATNGRAQGKEEGDDDHRTNDLLLTRGHYAALRAHLQGLPAATIGGLYLGHG